MNLQPPADLVRALLDNDAYLIVGHVDTDPDATGSVLALRRVLRARGKTCLAVTPTPLPEQLEFMPDRELLLAPEDVKEDDWKHLIVLDCGIERTGHVAGWASRAGVVINIDHHATNPGTGDYNWIDPRFAATAEMIAALARRLDVSIDRPLATLLYTGLAGDTGSFRFSNTTPRVLRLAADLQEVGIDVETINAHLYERYSLEYLRLLAEVLQTVQTSQDGRIIYGRVTDAMRRKVGASADDSDGFIQYLRLVRDADVAVLCSEIENGMVRVQLRSTAAVDVAAVARQLGGGGHARAAGVKMKGPIAEVERQILAAVTAALAE